MHYTVIYMNVSVTTVLELEEHNEDNLMWCLYFVYTILICFVKTIIFFENFLYKVFFFEKYAFILIAHNKRIQIYFITIEGRFISSS